MNISASIPLPLLANSIRILSMDAVEKAASGHPGMPMGMADVATVLFAKHLKYYPEQPNWADRDRFILSAGHGSMLLYALLYLTGYEDFTLEELQNFRQYHKRTAGHPEYGYGGGIEMTTGPLGQGLASAVGMAIAEKALSERSPTLTNHYTYVIAGDGCLMEGISHEALSLAGHLKLNKLIVLFDDNEISIDGKTSLTCSDNLAERMHAYGWQYLQCDGHNFDAIDEQITRARQSEKPTLIACKTIIGYGATQKQGTEKVHGSPLGKETIKNARAALQWTDETPFCIPKELLDVWRNIGKQHKNTYEEWNKNYQNYPDKATLHTYFHKSFPTDFPTIITDFKKETLRKSPRIATRKASQNVLEILTPILPQLLGGSADLTHSNLTQSRTQKTITPTDFSGTYLHYGVREFAMGAIMNGISLHEGFIPYGGTFLVFSDYLRSAIRLGALMKQQTIYVFTHDSIGLGEDGPTHQPVEHIASLSCIPNTYLFRPCDSIETIESWEIALGKKNAPSLLCLSRQELPTLRTKPTNENLTRKGAYILHTFQGSKQPILHLWASGSEVSLAYEIARELHEKENHTVQLISVPCLKLFYEQSADYQNTLRNRNHFHVAIEAGIGIRWDKIIGDKGLFFGVETFGVSAPATQVYEHFGLTQNGIYTKIRQHLSS